MTPKLPAKGHIQGHLKRGSSRSSTPSDRQIGIEQVHILYRVLSSCHKWLVILQVLQQSHLPPASWYHLKIQHMSASCAMHSQNCRAAKSVHLTVSSGWYQDRRALGLVLVLSATKVFCSVSFWDALHNRGNFR